MSAMIRTYKTNDIIFREGEPSNCIYLVKHGTISIRKKKGSDFVEIAKIHQKEIIGELSFFDRLPRSATAVAINAVELFEIPFEGLDKIYEGVPPYMKAIIASLADRLRKANDTIRRLQAKVIHEDESFADTALETLESELAAVESENAKIEKESTQATAPASGAPKATGTGPKGSPNPALAKSAATGTPAPAKPAAAPVKK
jgi:CRP/FNR family cyclic AMP-dependent transcriptional regulator